jgi:RNA polymerase sigma-54 factor
MQKQHILQKLQQKLTPQQIQMVKLLELPTYKLEQKIKKELEENPVLNAEIEKENEEPINTEDDPVSTTENGDNSSKEEDDFSMEDYIQEEDQDIPYYKLSVNNFDANSTKNEEIPFSVGKTLHESLEDQLGLTDLNDHQHAIGTYIIGNIDQDGYLRRGLNTIVDDLEFYEGTPSNEKEVSQIVSVIQSFDPPGIGARDLRECLLLQLNRKNHHKNPIRIAKKIIEEQYDTFTHKHYNKIQQQLNISYDELQDALNEILKLNPKPANSYNEFTYQSNEQIDPDFILENRDGQLILSLNNKGIPELSLNKTYVKMLEEHKKRKELSSKQKDKDTVGFVRQKLNSAKWFIDAVQQRQNTLLLTMNAILEYQRLYFLDGDESKLRPMVLKNIATEVDLDISTISRVVNSKYIQTHFGIFPLKYFFSEGLQTSSGEEISTREIKNILRKHVNEENKKKPLTDEKLADILKEKGYNIARRTVAKYREQMEIPVARLRKEL